MRRLPHPHNAESIHGLIEKEWDIPHNTMAAILTDTISSMLRVFQQPLEETILETESEEEEEIEQLSQEAGSYEEDFEERAEPRINLQGPYVNI